MPARWEVSNDSVSMSSFSDAVNINKYSDLHFSYIFYRMKVRSLHCQYHSLTYLNDEAVFSVLLVDLSKGRMEGLNRCWSTVLKLNFGQDFEVEVYINLKSDLFNNFEAGGFEGDFCQLFNVENQYNLISSNICYILNCHILFTLTF